MARENRARKLFEAARPGDALVARFITTLWDQPLSARALVSNRFGSVIPGDLCLVVSKSPHARSTSGGDLLVLTPAMTVGWQSAEYFEPAFDPA
jgi:hypothetical protein